MRGMNVEPDDRFPTMAALLAELRSDAALAGTRRFAEGAAAKLAGIWEAPDVDRPRGRGRRHRGQGRDPPRLPGDRQAVRGDGVRGDEPRARSVRAPLDRRLCRRLRGDAPARRAVDRGARPAHVGAGRGAARSARAVPRAAAGDGRHRRERRQRGDRAGHARALLRRESVARDRAAARGLGDLGRRRQHARAAVGDPRARARRARRRGHPRDRRRSRPRRGRSATRRCWPRCCWSRA